jgi:hypothetical protein
MWTEVRALHAARIAHGRLDAHHIVIGERGQPSIVGFDAASTSVEPAQSGRDVAQLLGTTATIVSPTRALRAARTGIGDDALDSALPFRRSHGTWSPLLPGAMGMGPRAARRVPRVASDAWP